MILSCRGVGSILKVGGGGHILNQSFQEMYDRVLKMRNFVSDYLKFEYSILHVNNWFENTKKLSKVYKEPICSQSITLKVRHKKDDLMRI